MANWRRDRQSKRERDSISIGTFLGNGTKEEVGPYVCCLVGLKHEKMGYLVNAWGREVNPIGQKNQIQSKYA